MQINCFVCNKPFMAQRKTRKFCSDSCKRIDYLKRNGFEYARKNTVGHCNPVVNDKEILSVVSPLQDKLDTCLFLIEQSESTNNSLHLQWIETRLKCLLTQLLRLCYLSSVEQDTFSDLQQAFKTITDSTNFKSLGNHFLAKYTLGLQREIQRLFSLTVTHGKAKLIIPPDQKALMLATLANMDSSVPLFLFYDLFKQLSHDNIKK